jgi:ubiquinone/menaquinone biosynthesis C-methylase UbiE
MYERFVTVGRIEPNETVLDVGVTSDRGYQSSNYLESWYPHKGQLTAVGLDDGSFLEKEFPGVRFAFANGKALPFRESAFDVVHSSAVIEHIGARNDQQRFIGELYRVARRLVCLTTPNRWFPVEVHTGLPLVHWLPARAFRRMLRISGLPFFADENNLNLLSRSDLLELCRSLRIRGARVEGLRLSGWTSNLILFLAKEGAVPHKRERGSRASRI